MGRETGQSWILSFPVEAALSSDAEQLRTAQDRACPFTSMAIPSLFVYVSLSSFADQFLEQ